MTTHYQKREILRLARSGHTRRLQQLLQNHVDINFLHHKTGMTPLMTAVHAGRVAAVELLLNFDADPNLRATDNASALHWACLRGDGNMVKMLIDAGAELNIRRETDRDDEGPAPIHMALGKSHDDVAILLVEAGASVGVRYFGLTVVEYAASCGCDAVVTYLRQLGVRT
ncbi:ankyrin repeat domain-containing protein [Bremerella sp. JC817]|uniref:ankyrin repeat domain-containing protein n=1 Tax=Bremerella sp. JC817 TaxID=3231756 RepID=UPI0034577000